MNTLTIESWPPVEGVMKIHKGSTFDPVMTWRDTNGPIDWTGYVGSAVLRFSEVTITLTTTIGNMTLGSDGKITLLITDTSDIPEEIGYFAISVVDNLTNVRILARGRVEVD